MLLLISIKPLLASQLLLLALVLGNHFISSAVDAASSRSRSKKHKGKAGGNIYIGAWNPPDLKSFEKNDETLTNLEDVLTYRQVRGEVTFRAFTNLYSTQIQKVIAPKNVEELRILVRDSPGPFSIAGGQFSQGGQVAVTDGILIDMRLISNVQFDATQKTLTAQSGASWRSVLEEIDGSDLSVEVMQSYATFTVGGALGVNCHGRYVGHGPIVHSVLSISVLIHDGTIIIATPQSANSDLFYGAIGGYGGLGVIIEATFRLTLNTKLLQTAVAMPLSVYSNYFNETILHPEPDSPRAILISTVIYPPYDNVISYQFWDTEDDLTINDRLYPDPERIPGKFDQFKLWCVSELPGGITLKRKFHDSKYAEYSVSMRNYEASLSVWSIEPNKRVKSTYVIQEYFVPKEELEDFVQTMSSILKSNKVNVIDLHVRHAIEDSQTLLSWSKSSTSTFALALYYKQGLKQSAKAKVLRWTNQLIEAALQHRGSYYLPYQVIATQEQFQRAYPRHGEYLAAKQLYDPRYKFRNNFLDTYFKPPISQ